MVKTLVLLSLLAVAGEEQKEKTFDAPTGPVTEVVAILE